MPVAASVDFNASIGPSDGGATGSLFDERKKSNASGKRGRNRILKGHGMTREELIEYEKRRAQTTVATVNRLDREEEAMLSGDRRAVQLWVVEAGGLVEDFRVVRQLFLSDRVSAVSTTRRYEVC